MHRWTCSVLRVWVQAWECPPAWRCMCVPLARCKSVRVGRSTCIIIRPLIASNKTKQNKTEKQEKRTNKHRWQSGPAMPFSLLSFNRLFTVFLLQILCLWLKCQLSMQWTRRQCCALVHTTDWRLEINGRLKSSSEATCKLDTDYNQPHTIIATTNALHARSGCIKIVALVAQFGHGPSMQKKNKNKNNECTVQTNPLFFRACAFEIEEKKRMNKIQKYSLFCMVLIY